jgi:TonB family protein
LARKIDEVKIYPADSIYRGEEGSVVVAVTIFPDGRIDHIHLVEWCPFEALNHAAVDTIRKLSKLPPLPQGRLSPLTVRVPLHFELKRS